MRVFCTLFQKHFLKSYRPPEALTLRAAKRAEEIIVIDGSAVLYYEIEYPLRNKEHAGGARKGGAKVRKP